MHLRLAWHSCSSRRFAATKVQNGHKHFVNRLSQQKREGKAHLGTTFKRPKNQNPGRQRCSLPSWLVFGRRIGPQCAIRRIIVRIVARICKRTGVSDDFLCKCNLQVSLPPPHPLSPSPPPPKLVQALFRGSEEITLLWFHSSINCRCTPFPPSLTATQLLTCNY